MTLTDPDMPVNVDITGWSPFIPGDADNSSLPVGDWNTLSKIPGDKDLEAVFSFNSENFMRVQVPSEWGDQYVGKDSILEMDNGFILEQPCFPDKPHYKGEFAVFTDAPSAVVDYCWFRGDWFDSRTILWNNIEKGNMPSNPVSAGAKGASVYVPLKLKPDESKTIKVYVAWYVPHSDVRAGSDPETACCCHGKKPAVCKPGSSCCEEIASKYYEPWYSGKFKDVKEVAKYWRTQYADLKGKTELFTNAFYDSDLPPEVTGGHCSQPYHSEIPYRLATERREIMGLGRLSRPEWLLQRFMHACMELCPGNSTFVSFPGTYPA